MAGKADEIQALLAPTVASLGLELLGVEYVPSGASALLRLYIDVEGRQVGIEDCESASREVSALLDVEDPITSEYTLEVSSPGIDRPLFSVAQFARFAGEQARIQLRLPKDGRRRFTGRIVSASGDSIVMRDDTGEFSIAHDNIDKARLVPDLVALGLAAAPKPGGPRGRKSRPDPAAAVAGDTDASDKA